MKWGEFQLDMKGGKFAANYGSEPQRYQFGSLKGVKKSKLRYTPSSWAEFSERKEMAEHLRSKKL